jgi:hypothetical protein
MQEHTTPQAQAQRPLRSEELIAEAEASTGLTDWGRDNSFRIGLGELAAAVEAMPCAAVLRPVVRGTVGQLLTTRLHLVEDEQQHPEVLRQPITRPLIVAGLVRTGTTWLFDLLALDPNARAPLNWELSAPWPAPEIATYNTDPRIAAAQAGMDAMVAAVPEFAVMHRSSATAPEECNMLLTYHFESANFWASWDVPNYVDWLLRSSAEGMFITHRRILQQLQWKGPRGRWLLKSPLHLLHLDKLFEAYPDACIIQTHREPALLMPSLADLVAALRRVQFAGEPALNDKPGIAAGVIKIYSEAIDRLVQQRKNPDIDRHFVDIPYEQLVRDPKAAVKHIYSYFGFPMSDTFERRLDDYIALPRQEGPGKHKYRREEYRMPADILDRWPDYRRRFGHLLGEP